MVPFCYSSFYRLHFLFISLLLLLKKAQYILLLCIATAPILVRFSVHTITFNCFSTCAYFCTDSTMHKSVSPLLLLLLLNTIDSLLGDAELNIFFIHSANNNVIGSSSSIIDEDDVVINDDELIILVVVVATVVEVMILIVIWFISLFLLNLLLLLVVVVMVEAAVVVLLEISFFLWVTLVLFHYGLLYQFQYFIYLLLLFKKLLGTQIKNCFFFHFFFFFFFCWWWWRQQWWYYWRIRFSISCYKDTSSSNSLYSFGWWWWWRWSRNFFFFSISRYGNILLQFLVQIPLFIYLLLLPKKNVSTKIKDASSSSTFSASAGGGECSNGGGGSTMDNFVFLSVATILPLLISTLSYIAV